MSLDDGLPQKLCENCIQRLEDAFRLKELCEKSDKTLREIVKVNEEEQQLEVKSEPLDCNSYVDCDGISNHADDESPANNSAKSEIMNKDLDRHKCNQCNQSFNTISAISSHLIKEHNTQPFRCEKCDRRFLNALQLKEHLQSDSLKEESPINSSAKTETMKKDLEQYKCDMCDEMFNSKLAKSSHLVKIHNNQTFRCEKCDGIFLNVLQLNEHLQSDCLKGMKKDFHKCDICDKLFNSKRAKSSHLVRKHNIQTFNFKCEKCDRKFFNALQLKEHLQSDCLKCEHCGKTYINIRKLRKHSIHHRSKEVHCFKCDKSFIFKWMLDKHDQQFHSGPRSKEACVICGHILFSHCMAAHMKTHRERTRLSCSECPKTFIKKVTLKDHIMKVHRNEQIPLKQLCTLCGRAFRGKAELTLHMRSHTDERPFSCTSCEKRFREQKSLRSHVLYIHKDVRTFPCDVCSKMFHTKSILKAHSLTHTDIRPHTCLVCNKSFRSKMWLKTHTKSHTRP